MFSNSLLGDLNDSAIKAKLWLYLTVQILNRWFLKDKFFEVELLRQKASHIYHNFNMRCQISLKAAKNFTAFAPDCSYYTDIFIILSVA